MKSYIASLEAKGKPVIFTGDLNVGHLDVDIHNPEAKHIVKQAGLTPVERLSFTSLLENYVDAFRFFYPTAKGQFSYWSQRTSARPVNRGIRLDYFICSKSMFPSSVGVEGAASGARTIVKSTSPVTKPTVRDSYILFEDTVGLSDHAPVVLTIEVPLL